MMKPDYERAAIATTKTLITYGVSTEPVFNIPISPIADFGSYMDGYEE